MMRGLFCSVGRCLLALLLGLWVLDAGAGGGRALAADRAQPPAAVWGNSPGDDLKLQGLVTAAEISLRIMGGRDDQRRYQFCGRSYTLAELRQSLTAFTAAARAAADPAELAAYVEQNFVFCPQAGPGEQDQRAFLTGYFEPEVAGSLEPDEQYRYPLYAPPADLVTSKGRTGRLQDGRLEPYWSRRQIEEQDLLAGKELVYLADPLEAFVLHVQGSGRVRLPDGQIRPVLYAAKSGREYRSIGRLLIEEGELSREDADLPGILAYLRQNPEEIKRVLHHNQSYIFFRLGEPGEPAPLGSFGRPLTAGRSLALDQQYYPPGALTWLAAEKPRFNDEGTVTDWQPMGRFAFNQDSGSAIQGRGRVDLFWGHDDYAARAAGVSRHRADLYLLLPEKR